MKKPVRTAYSDAKGSPARYSASPRTTVRRVATMASRRSICSTDMPTGRHSSRKLQLPQATLNGSMRMTYAEVWVAFCTVLVFGSLTESMAQAAHGPTWP